MARKRRKPFVVATLTLMLMVLGVGAGWAAYLNHQLDDVGRISVDFGPDRAKERPRTPAPEGEREGGRGGDTYSSGGVERDSGGQDHGGKGDGSGDTDGEQGGVGTSTSGAEPVTILIAGVDAGEGPRIAADLADGSWTPGSYRTDTIMVLHLSADRRSAQLVSVPRDSWVQVPGNGMGKVNSAFSLGGPSLYVRTVERLTGVDMDHLMIIDWKAFKRITTAVGGVKVRIPAEVYDPSQDVRWEAGTHRLEGEQALQYVRQRHGLPRGDFHRIDRQQNFVRATLVKVLSDETLMNPVKLTQVLQTVGDHLLVDDRLSSSDLRDLALSVRGLKQEKVDFLTIPTRSLDTVQGQKVVRVDRRQTRQLFQALVGDRINGYLERHDADRLSDPGRVR